MLKTLKEKLRRYLFKDEYLKLELARRQPVKVTEMVRQQLVGFDKRLLTETGDVLDQWTRIKTEDTKLEQVHQIAQASALRDILAWLKREQIYFAVMQSENIDQVNFARATVNGLVLLEETIDRLDGVYRERVSTPEPYDKHDVI